MSEKTTEQMELRQYQRTFSDLGEYQSPHSMVYRLYQQEQGCLFVIERQGESPKAVQLAATLAKETAMQLLTLLYENAVSIELCGDLLAEYNVTLVS